MYNYSMDIKHKFLFETQEGIILCVKLSVNSSCNKIVDYTDEYIRIKISAPPLENRANKELISYLSEIFDINKSKIKIVSGDKSKLKKLIIADTKIEYIIQKLMFMLDSVHKEK